MSAVFQNIQPYLKYIALLVGFLIYLVFLLFFYKKVFNDPQLKAWFIKSLTDPNTQGASGKSLMALMFSKIIALASIVSFIWSPNHLMPDYYFITIVGFIAAIYGIKLAGRFTNSNGSNIDMTGNTDIPDKKDDDNKKEPNIPSN